MPTYDFECPDCGHTFEQMQSITAKPLKLCPKCGKRHVRRLIGAGGGLIFKGSGFYLTDYARKGGEEEKDSKADAKPDGKPDAKPDSKPESKPEAKTETKAETKTESKAESKPTKPAKNK